jgi:ribosomal protein S18 acetylase RimI-like enzyme
MLEIREAVEEDRPAVWEIIKAVIAAGDTYTFAPDSTEKEMLDFWFAPDKHTYVAVMSESGEAEEGGNATVMERVSSGRFSSERASYDPGEQIAGTFFLKANQPGLGSHVGNAGYMVKPGIYGKGIGRQMAEWSLDECRRLGFKALQFNFVVKSNTYAVKLWQSIGMEIIGEIPDAFDHAENGLTNAYIMYRKL